jgi:hypothetical protein
MKKKDLILQIENSSWVSLAFGNLIASSDHKSTHRRFGKFSKSSFRGNSPNSSWNAHNKEMLEMSNPYYDQQDNSSSHRGSNRRLKKK